MLRKQAKQTAVEASLLKHAELTGKSPPTVNNYAIRNETMPNYCDITNVFKILSPIATPTAGILNGDLQLKRLKEPIDFDIAGDHNSTAAIPSYASNKNTKSLLTLPENEGYTKKRTF